MSDNRRTTVLHEILAVEKTRNDQLSVLMKDTTAKFGKFEWFQGHHKRLKMLEETPQNKVLEAQAAETRALPTTVHETLEYLLNFWAEAEDVQMAKNCTNQDAKADLEFRGTVILEAVPVDELLGLESRLQGLRSIMAAMPTLQAAIRYVPDPDSGRKGSWRAAEESKTVKTEKVTRPVVLYEATDKHPAQIEKVSTDSVVGEFSLLSVCGAATSAQKAEAISIIDDLLAEAKKARMRANMTPVSNRKIGKVLTDLIMKPFTDA